MLFHNHDISKILDCRQIIQYSGKRKINALVYDSRRVLEGESSLFFALKTIRDDGHNYIIKAYRRGIREFIISDLDFPVKDYHEANFYIYDDTLQALQLLAKFLRSNLNSKIIAITGSNGKTICKEWLHELLNKDSFRSPLSYNSQIGVPLSISMIPSSAKTAIIEAGISTVGEMEKHSEMIRPDDVIITNIGQAHNEGFADLNQKLKEKCILAKHASRVFYNSDQTELDQYLRVTFPNKKLISWGNKAEDHLNIQKMDGQTVVLNKNGQKHQFKFHMQDAISLENLGHVLNYILYNTEDTDLILNRCQNLSSVEMRLQLVNGINKCKIINDCYNADLYSLTRAVSYIDQQISKYKTIVLSPLEDTGLTDEEATTAIADILNSIRFNKLMLVGEKLFPLAPLIRKEVDVILLDSTDHLKDQYFDDELILVKGARKYMLEDFVDHLQLKAQTTALEINLSALEKNLEYFRTKLNDETKIMAVIKASGYGSGSHMVARTLENREIDYLAVALIDEGIYLREQGISSPIVVLNPDIYNLNKLFQYNLQAEVYHLDLLKQLIKVSNKIQSPCGIHLNLDTGMNRLGFKREDITELVSLVSEAPFITIKSIFTHLASSEDIIQDQATEQQVNEYEESITLLEEYLDQPFLKHVLNTSGILRHPQYQMDMVRTGLGLYGLDLSGKEKSHLQKVHSLKSFILQIKHIKAGEHVGYGSTFQASHDMRIATLNIGYADGLRRSLSNGNWSVKIHGQLAPIVGKISMDLTTIDITNITDAKLGDQVVIFDEQLSLESFSQACDTIPYEILTGISDRVKRIYYKE